jgi:hypothetical protein
VLQAAADFLTLRSLSRFEPDGKTDLPREWWLKGVKIQIYSSGCGSVVLMQETAELVAALDGTAGR